MDEDKGLSTPSNQLFDETTSLQATPPTVPKKNIVPLITPRYQKKQRTHRYIEVTDSSSERISATTALQQHVREVLTVQNGPVSYEQEMFFHPYELYKHGKHKIHTSSVGYSSECDLVVTREAISEPSDVDLGFVRRRAEIHKAICLDPKARRPITEAESKKKLRLNSGKFRKYPGIRAPKNRKERNRLLNDYFATEYARKIRDKYRERKENGDDDEETSPPVRPVFGNLPSSFYDILDLDEDAQTRALEKFGIYQRHGTTNNNVPKDPDSGESRFQGMNSRLRGELIHALNSVFLSQQIDDLERAFINYISEGNANKPLTYNFRDGYGRLVCHGVAAYYNLVSESQYQSDGTKITIVSWPKKKKNDRKPLTLPHTTLMQLLRKKRSDMPHSSSLASTPQTTPFGKPEESDVMPPPFNLDDSPVEEQQQQQQEQQELLLCMSGLNPKEAGISNLQNESSPQKIPVYKPSTVIPAEGISVMTATEKKKMRKSMKLAQQDGSRNVENIVCAP